LGLKLPHVGSRDEAEHIFAWPRVANRAHRFSRTRRAAAQVANSGESPAPARSAVRARASGVDC